MKTFDVTIHRNTVFFPAAIDAVIRAQNLRSLEEFISYATAFPTPLAEALGWSTSDVQPAIDALVVQCSGILDERFVALLKTPPPKVSFGALIPR